MPYFDVIAWDPEDDPDGNVRHVAINGITAEEWEEVFLSPDARDGTSRTSGLPTRRGTTAAGKDIFIVFDITDEDGVIVVFPVTAYEPTERPDHGDEP